ncbi:MAG: hypothetical protein EXQ55_05720 [Acidobacteria bacterium]|nr:hypothetical protein [Acidobacteriota bacterium]
MRPFVLALLLLATPFAQDRPLPEFDTFAVQVKAHLETDEERQSGYMFIERRSEQKLDASGRQTSESVKMFEVYPGLPGEDRYRRLIEEDGKRLVPNELAKEDRERRQTVESYGRKLTSESERRKADRELDKQRRKYAAAVDDLFRIYDIRMVGRKPIDGHDTVVATLHPKAGVKPMTDDGKIMRHFKARAWISESDYELVRVEIEAIDDLTFGIGLLARVHAGTVASFERRKVNNEIWLPANVTWTASARVFLVRRLRLRGVSEFSGYRKFTVDTSTTYTRPPQ